MNSATLRRLATDHAALHKAELPPYYLFPPSNNGMPDDLTQLTILLTGPQGTPYSAGVWKLHFKIPHDFPKSPPKAAFKTKIWHPNVEESTGSICLETLKRDWQPKLTLRDILVTISCLLIQPNPDSALNASAGKLLQEDYEAFAMQAKLMTSIHAAVPSTLAQAVYQAKSRGEDVMKPSAPLQARSVGADDIKCRKRSHQSLHLSTYPSPPAVEDESDAEDDEASASKENNPSISPLPVPPPALLSRRPILGKRPLSDLPTPIESDDEDEYDDGGNMTSSERNIAKNTPNLSTSFSSISVSCEPQRKYFKLSERSWASSNSTGRTRDESNNAGSFTFFEDADDQDYERQTSKRICLQEGKENILEDVSSASAAQPKSTTPTIGLGLKTLSGAELVRKPSAPHVPIGAGVPKAKPRVGLRRL